MIAALVFVGLVFAWLVVAEVYWWRKLWALERRIARLEWGPEPQRPPPPPPPHPSSDPGVESRTGMGSRW